MRVYEVVSDPFQKEGQEDWFLTCSIMIEGEDDFRKENIKFPSLEQAEAFATFMDNLEKQVDQHIETLMVELDHFTEMAEHGVYVVLTEVGDEDNKNPELTVVH